ncbi:MAG: hypothetical protein JW940_08885 [Polyangiaceae bacterium]|nr:hypothetical protein [Polyangiaceae bacterium]
MKRLFLWSLVSAPAALMGCHDGHSEHGCIADVECAPGYVCDLLDNECVRPTRRCHGPEDCGTNETCGSERVCRVGDCSFHGCVAGFSCEIVDARYSCVNESRAAAGAAGAPGTAESSSAAGAEAGGASAGAAGCGAGGELGRAGAAGATQAGAGSFGG